MKILAGILAWIIVTVFLLIPIYIGLYYVGISLDTFTHDEVKAFCVGAFCASVGSLLADTLEEASE